MSYDLTLFHAPKLRSFDKGMARLDQCKRASRAEAARLQAVMDFVLGDGAARGSLSVDPALDAEAGTLGLALTGPRVSEVLEALLPVLRANGVVCYDPQEAVFYYANGSDSRLEKVSAGVHEGVGICLRDLRARPPLPAPERLDALDALSQFASADSPDPAAALRAALPVLMEVADDPDEAVRDKARSVIYDLCTGLSQEGRTLGLDGEALGALAARAPGWLAEVVRACG